MIIIIKYNVRYFGLLCRPLYYSCAVSYFLEIYGYPSIVVCIYLDGVFPLSKKLVLKECTD